jgi:hypothetical protein
VVYVTKTSTTGVCAATLAPRNLDADADEMSLEKREGDLAGNYERRIGKVMRVALGV